MNITLICEQSWTRMIIAFVLILYTINEEFHSGIDVTMMGDVTLAIYTIKWASLFALFCGFWFRFELNDKLGFVGGE